MRLILFHYVKIGLLSRSESSTRIRRIYLKLLAAASIIWGTKKNATQACRLFINVMVTTLREAGLFYAERERNHCEQQCTSLSHSEIPATRRVHGYLADCVRNELLMRGPEELENSEFCFPQISMLPETKSKEKIEIRESETKFTVPKGTSH